MRIYILSLVLAYLEANSFLGSVAAIYIPSSPSNVYSRPVSNYPNSKSSPSYGSETQSSPKVVMENVVCQPVPSKNVEQLEKVCTCYYRQKEAPPVSGYDYGYEYPYDDNSNMNDNNDQGPVIQEDYTPPLYGDIPEESVIEEQDHFTEEIPGNMGTIDPEITSQLDQVVDEGSDAMENNPIPQEDKVVGTISQNQPSLTPLDEPSVTLPGDMDTFPDNFGQEMEDYTTDNVTDYDIDGNNVQPFDEHGPPKFEEMEDYPTVNVADDGADRNNVQSVNTHEAQKFGSEANQDQGEMPENYDEGYY